jgi:hypothetical protein
VLAVVLLVHLHKFLDLGHIITHYVNEKEIQFSCCKTSLCRGLHLVNFGEPILEEDFQAWMHGPPELYQDLKEF